MAAFHFKPFSGRLLMLNTHKHFQSVLLNTFNFKNVSEAEVLTENYTQLSIKPYNFSKT